MPKRPDNHGIIKITPTLSAVPRGDLLLMVGGLEADLPPEKDDVSLNRHLLYRFDEA